MPRARRRTRDCWIPRDQSPSVPAPAHAAVVVAETTTTKTLFPRRCHSHRVRRGSSRNKTRDQVREGRSSCPVRCEREEPRRNPRRQLATRTRDLATFPSYPNWRRGSSPRLDRRCRTRTPPRLTFPRRRRQRRLLLRLTPKKKKNFRRRRRRHRRYCLYRCSSARASRRCYRRRRRAQRRRCRRGWDRKEASRRQDPVTR